jgi:hypothetical protein
MSTNTDTREAFSHSLPDLGLAKVIVQFVLSKRASEKVSYLKFKLMTPKSSAALILPMALTIAHRTIVASQKRSSDKNSRGYAAEVIGPGSMLSNGVSVGVVEASVIRS